ncbi:MAG: TVP38/TMEM64 family protein [Candidatus Aminicenantales bacterium]|jgi:uncharacterized membrane protein YdjX (TVP38/TMEM64 family)
MDGEKPHRARLAARAAILAVFLGLIIFASVKLTPSVTRLIRRPEDFKAFIDSYGPVSALVYILIQALQVVVFVIPGEIVQVAGGYIFGTGLGTLYSVAGILLGTMIAFFTARILGYSLVKAIVSPKKLEEFDFLINNPKSEIAMFVLFLVPGIPKDSLVYISGLTPVKPLRFFVISMVARFPGLWGSTYIGANLQEKDYLPVWVLSGVALVLFVVGALNRDRIIGWLHHLRHHGGEGPPDR